MAQEASGTTVKWEGPDTLPCPQQCEVPEGHTLFEVPTPRHNWSDVLVCPNKCGRAFLVAQ